MALKRGEPIPLGSCAARLPSRAGRGLVHVVIDTPMGSRAKFKLDESTGCFTLSRILPPGAMFPYDFGFIPRTRADDGDALDVLVIGNAPMTVGIVVTAKVIGTLRGRQAEKGRMIVNDRLVAVPVTPVNPPLFANLRELPRAWIEQVQHFFVSYNQAQGRTYRATGVSGPAAAEKSIRAAERRFASEVSR